MSHNPFDDLPDQMREAIKEMMKKLQEIDPEELENMVEQVLGKEFLEKMRDMQFSGSSFGFPLDPSMMKKMEGMMKNMMDNESRPQDTGMEIEIEEPYYEISTMNEAEGQIIVDLPGIEDVRQVQWQRTEFGIELTAENEDVKFAVDIPLAKKFVLKDIFATLKNSVFVLPYRGTE